MQTGSELDQFYKDPDPWGYQKHPDDIARKLEILQLIDHRYERALDIGCGEGWITKDINADEIHGIEFSPIAASRCPANVRIISDPIGKYDLVLLCGVLYRHYDYDAMVGMARKAASRTIITCNIADWEVPDVSRLGEQIFTKTFKYRQYQQRLRVFEVIA